MQESLGGATASTRNTPGRRTARTSSSGAKARSGTSTSHRRWQARFRSARGWSRRSTSRCVFPQEVHPKRFPVRMLRDVMVSPDGHGRRLQRARARLRSKRLPTGEPSGSPATPRSSSNPSFSPDGRQIVYIDLDATTCAAASVVSSGEGGDGHDDRHARRATTPSRRSRPTAAVTYRARQRRRRCAAAIFGRDPGLYRRPGADGAARRGSSAKAAPNRSSITPATGIYFRERRDEKYVLASVELDGRGRTGALSVRRTRRRSCPRLTGNGWRSRSAIHAFVAAFPAVRPTRRSGTQGLGVPGRAGLARRRDVICTGRGTARAALGARPGALHARSAKTFTFVDRRAEKPDEPRSDRAYHRLHTRRATCRPARSRSRARASSR